MAVSISPLARPEQVVNGKITIKGSVVDRTSRTGLVEIHLDNKDGALIAGSAVRATIELSRRDGVILIPAEAAILSVDTSRTGAAQVFIQDGDKAKARAVKIGVRQGDDIEIVEGLSVGEPVVVRGAGFLRDGNPIRVAATRAETAIDVKKAGIAQ